VLATIICLLETSAEKPSWDDVALKHRDVKVLWAMWPRLAVRDGLLKRRFEDAATGVNKWQVIMPRTLREEFMSIAHGGMTGGHLGKKKTAAAIQSRAYWPTWSSDLDSFIKRCDSCARYHRGSVPHRAPMQTPLVGEPWERISVDITGPHPKSSRGNQFIVTVVDHFSKWAEAIPVANHKAPVVARVPMNHAFTRFGAPLQLLTDRGPEFESELFTLLMRWMEIDKLRTTAYQPATNGVVERFHRTLNSMLGKVVCDSLRDWDERLPLVMAAYRASPHSSTGLSPNRLFMGRENRMPLDLVMGLPTNEANPAEDTNEYIAKLKEHADKAYEYARKHLQVAAERRKTDYDIRVKEQKFCVGDWVWYYYPRRFKGKSPKWQKHYNGPYLVVKVIEPSNYVLQRSSGANPFVVHADKLKRYYSSTTPNWLTDDATLASGEPDEEAELQTMSVPTGRHHLPAGTTPMPNNDVLPPFDVALGNNSCPSLEPTELNG
jgi:transposase InsO family protein